jgi:transcriptional regulator with PAS, ATPase and Fis domain
LAINSIEKNKRLESTTEYQIVHNDQVKDTLLSLSAYPYEYKGKRFCLLTIENLKSEVADDEAETKVGFHGIVGQNEKMLDLFDTIKQIRSSNDPVLLQGESGTGKELVAIAIHRESKRANRNFVPVNCGALPEGLLESEMFGHIKGAFTGATYNKKGRFKLSDQGTIFLDEISELSPSMQAKFLRAIETGTYEPVGSDQPVTVNVRVISATNTLLEKEINKGRFRSDLYYRLCVIPILIPPLRDRRDDIPRLADYYLDKFSRNTPHTKMEFSKEAISIIENYDWPGNVRELQNILKYAVLKCKGSRITPVHFPYYLFKNKIHHVVGRRRKLKLELTDVADALRKTNGNKRWAAELLGVSRSTLYRYFERQKLRAKESP